MASAARDWRDVLIRYADLTGRDLSGLRLVESAVPRNTRGRPVKAPGSFGGCWTRDGVYVNPELDAVADAYGVPRRGFRKRLLAHEAAHELWNNAMPRKEREKYVRAADKAGYTTKYLDTVDTDAKSEDGTSRRDQELFCEYMAHLMLDKKAEFSDGSYEDAKAVYESLSDADKEFVTPGRREYRDARGKLAARTVAYDNKVPVGVADLYGPYVIDRKGAKPYYNVWTAVSPDHRGRHLSPDLVKESIRKLVRRLRSEGTLAQDAVPRVEWHFLEGNERSRHAARNAGFVRKGKRKYALGE